MSALEGEIFGIDADIFPALGWASERYLNLVGFARSVKITPKICGANSHWIVTVTM
jgi:hypothetical protein